MESAKYLAELAFTGGRVENEEILVAHGQKDGNTPPVPPGASPITIMLTLKANAEKCSAAYDAYLQATRTARHQYQEKQERLMELADSGVPGSCSETVELMWGTWQFQISESDSPTIRKRNEWNNTVDDLEDLCTELQNAERNYVDKCNLDYHIDQSQDTCNSIKAMKLIGTTQVWDLHNFWESIWDFFIALFTFNWSGFNWNVIPCSNWIEWHNFYGHSSFNSSACRDEGRNHTPTPTSCKNAISTLFENIDKNISLTAQDDFVSA